MGRVQVRTGSAPIFVVASCDKEQGADSILASPQKILSNHGQMSRQSILSEILKSMINKEKLRFLGCTARYAVMLTGA